MSPDLMLVKLALNRDFVIIPFVTSKARKGLGETDYFVNEI